MQEKNEKTKALIKKRDEIQAKKLVNAMKEREVLVEQFKLNQREKTSMSTRPPLPFSINTQEVKARGNKTQNSARSKVPPSPRTMTQT
mgnify:CR=1 FL=1|jgi:hypothetical protein